MVTNNQYLFAYQRQRQPIQRKGVLELEGVDTILAQNKLMHQQIQQQMEIMAKRVDGLKLASVSTTNQASIEWGQNEAGNVEQQQEQVQYMQNTSSSFQNDFHGDTYNSSWRNHPNLRWGDNQNQWQKNNNSNHSRNTHNQNHSSNNTNQYKKPQNTYQPPHNNSQTHQNNFSTPPFNSQNAHLNAPNNFQPQQSYPTIPPIDHHETRISSLEAALQALTQNTQSLA
ncbi:GATA zinc finger domain-containing protein 14-like [Arachis ipaensis]|uniref:GATA zinc finger domain-containing protein 14-like n=1 Tax=Arachis ipaensis TaxID=130454 RepID=UPI0007AFC961|nr:GATA zinc finger domain-containing protein 14-like [Arachis ipaensis]